MTPRILILLLIPVVFSMVCFFLLKYWVKMRRESSFLIAVATLLAAAAMVAWRAFQLHHQPLGPQGNESRLLGFACLALLFAFAVPLGIKLYRAWTGIQISPEEQSPGGIGVRAWLTPGNLIVTSIIAGCAAGAYDYPFFGVFGLLVGCLLIQPLINTARVPVAVVSSTAEPSLVAEREKVLSLLESGRITAEESAELLNALGSTAQIAKPAVPASRQQRMALIGAGLVLFGFFLPWFSYNPGKELDRMMNGASMEQLYQLLPKDMSGNPMKLGMEIKTPTAHISGGDVDKGLGWLVLLLGLGTAGLPYLAATMDSATRRMVSFIALGIGGIVLLWLLSQNLRFINAGVIVVLAGYVIQFLGLLNPRLQTVESGVTAEERV